MKTKLDVTWIKRISKVGAKLGVVIAKAKHRHHNGLAQGLPVGSGFPRFAAFFHSAENA